MYIMQLAHLKNLGQEKSNNNESNINLIGKDNLIEKKTEGKDEDAAIPNQVKNQLKATNQIKTNPVKSFDNRNENITFPWGFK